MKATECSTLLTLNLTVKWTYGLDFLSPLSCGHDPYTCKKSQVKGESESSSGNRRTNGRTRPISLPILLTQSAQEVVSIGAKQGRINGAFVWANRKLKYEIFKICGAPLIIYSSRYAVLLTTEKIDLYLTYV